MTHLILDGGGSSLKIWLQQGDAPAKLQKRLKGNFNFQSGKRTEIIDALKDAIERHPSSLVSIGLAGLLLADDKAWLARKLTLKNVQLAVMSDLELCFQIYFPNSDGMVAILGTGSVFAAKVNGALTKVGGYGKLISDAGSAAAIGLGAARNYMKLLDGFFVDDEFAKAMKKFFPTRNALIEKIYRENFTLQSLAPVIIRLAAKKNSTAEQLLDDESDAVCEYLALLAKKIPTALPLKLCGGLVETANTYKKTLCEKIAQQGIELMK
jgi:N-acetylglucosamine kinase-like BadF-type ATPase